MEPSSRSSAGMRRQVLARRWSGDAGTPFRDEVAVEEPMELRVETRPVAVVMRTPGQDEELAAGFLLTEGVVRRPEDIRLIRRHPRHRNGNVIEVYLAAGVTVDYAQLTRHVFAASSCGLCGKTTIASIRTRFPRATGSWQVDAGTLLGLPQAMREAQTVFGATGGLHAAALFGIDGTLLALREDVGRHNAVDKLLGRALLDGRLPLEDCVLLVSGRTSFEILQKALAGGVSLVAAVGAPSSLAVDFARASGQTLVGFLRDGRFNVYSGPRRVRHRRG